MMLSIKYLHIMKTTDFIMMLLFTAAVTIIGFYGIGLICVLLTFIFDEIIDINVLEEFFDMLCSVFFIFSEEYLTASIVLAIIVWIILAFIIYMNND